MSRYNRSAIVIVDAANQEAAEVIARELDPGTPPDDEVFFSQALSADGNEPVEFYLMQANVTEETYETIRLKQHYDFPDSYLYRGYNPYDTEEGPSRYTWQDAVQKVGMQIINNNPFSGE